MKKDKTKYKIPSYIPMYPFGGDLKGDNFGETLSNVVREKGLTSVMFGGAGVAADLLSKGKFSNWVNEHGTLIGTVGGAAVGAAAGNPMAGAQIGGQVGGFVQQAEAKDDQYLLDEKNVNNFNNRSLAQQRIMGLPQSQMSFGNGGKIYIKPENRGKFNATKARTGKTTEELTHSSNPITRKRAIFAQNAAKWKHPDGGYLPTTVDSAYVTTAANYRPSYIKTQQYGDFDKAANGDLLSSRPLYDPNNKKVVIGSENYYKGVPGPIYLNQNDTEGARMEKYNINGKTRFAGSETPTFCKGGKMANGGQLKGTKYNEDITYYPNGGTHESSKLGGIPIGNKGLVEEGEVRFKDYIFSNRY